MQGHGFKIGEGLSRRFTIVRAGDQPGAVPSDRVRRRMLADAASTATGGFAGLALGFQEAHSFWPWTRARGRRLIADSLRDLAEAGVALFAFADAERRANGGHDGGPVDLRDMRHFMGERGGETVVPFPFYGMGRGFRPSEAEDLESRTFTAEEARASVERTTGLPVNAVENLFVGEESLYDAGAFPDAEGLVSDRPFGGAVSPGDPVAEAVIAEEREIARLARSFDDGPLASVRRAGLQSDGGSPT